MGVRTGHHEWKVSTRPMTPFYADATETLAVFWDGRPHTRADLQQRTGRARNTVTKHLDLLSRHHLIANAGKDPAATGRPSDRFQLNAGAGALAVVQLDGDRARLTLADLAGRVRGRCSVQPDLLARGLARAAETFLPGAPVLTVLLADSGIDDLDPDALAHDLHAAVHVRPWAELALVAEAVSGTVLCLDVECTVRAATLLDGRVVSGAGGLAGSVGSLVLPSQEFALGIACRRSLDDVLSVARRRPDDPRVQLAAGRHLGQAAAAFCRLVDPGTLLLAGHAARNRAFRTGLLDAVTARTRWGGRIEVRPVAGDLRTAIARGGCVEARQLTGTPEQLDRVLRTVDGSALLAG